MAIMTNAIVDWSNGTITEVAVDYAWYQAVLDELGVEETHHPDEEAGLYLDPQRAELLAEARRRLDEALAGGPGSRVVAIRRMRPAATA